MCEKMLWSRIFPGRPTFEQSITVSLDERKKSTPSQDCRAVPARRFSAIYWISYVVSSYLQCSQLPSWASAILPTLPIDLATRRPRAIIFTLCPRHSWSH
jgi:hypothetical protein